MYDVVHTNPTNAKEPSYKDRSKKKANSMCPIMLKSKQSDQNHASNKYCTICIPEENVTKREYQLPTWEPSNLIVAFWQINLLKKIILV